MAASTTHEPQAVILPVQGRRADATKGVPVGGSVAYLMQCTGCPWHTANPVTFRLMVATQDMGWKTGQKVTVTHGKSGGWWGTWKVLGIVTPEGTTVKVEGTGNRQHDGKNPGLWVVGPLPVEEKQDEETEPEGTPEVNAEGTEQKQDTAAQAA